MGYTENINLSCAIYIIGRMVFILISVNYINTDTKVNITCPHHGDFSQSPTSHLSGSGCPKCAKHGFKTWEQASLYVFKCNETTKVGITNRKASKRLREVSKSSGKVFDQLLEIRLISGLVAQKVESDILSSLRSTHESPLEKYDGKTESFLNVDYDDLLLKITRSCGQHLPNYQ